MKNTFFYIAILFIALVAASCRKSDDDTPTPTQTIIPSDSSGNAGQLFVDVFDVNGNEINQVEVRLYITYNDMQKNLPLYTFTSNNNGRVDFGFVLQGNYYLTGISNNGTLRDTTVAQVLPKRSVTRKLILR